MQSTSPCRLLYAALACTAAACGDPLDPVAPRVTTGAAALAAASNGGAPAPNEFELVSDELCPGISLQLEGSGKAKTLTVGKNGTVTIFLSPGLDVRLTNLSTGKQVTVPISGASHQQVDPSGNLVTVMTGRNLSFDPIAEPHFAFTSGAFSFAFDPSGTLVQPRQGQGQITDACALIS